MPVRLDVGGMQNARVVGQAVAHIGSRWATETPQFIDLEGENAEYVVHIGPHLGRS